MDRRMLSVLSLVACSLMGLSTVVFAQNSLTPNDPGFSQQWYLEKIKAPEAWARGRELRGSLGQGSADVIIAVIDSGVDIDHPDLKGNIWTNPGEIPHNGIDDEHNGYIDDVNGWDFLTSTNDPKPKVDNDADLSRSPLGVHHGTIIAGLAAAVGDNDEGVSGVVWHSSILSLRVIRSDGSGEATQVAQAVDYAIAQGAKVINLSFVGDTNTSVLANAVTRAEKAGVLIIAAAGNQSRADGSVHVYDLDATPLYPICHDGLSNAVIGVTSTDSNDQKSSFASFGTQCIDVSAPGEKLIVTRATDPQFGPVRLYGSPVEGTSMSTALVSGSAALLKSLFPNVSMKRIGVVLMSSADSVDTSNPTYINRMGRGRINLVSAVEELASELPVIPVPLVEPPIIPVLPIIKQYKDVTVTERFRTPTLLTIDIRDLAGTSVRSIDIPTTVTVLPSIAILSSGNIVLGAPPGQEPWVRVYSPQGILEHSRVVYPPAMRGGVSVIAYGEGNQIAVLPLRNAGGQLLLLGSDLKTIRQQFIASSTIRANWIMGRLLGADGDHGVIVVGSHAPLSAIIVTPVRSTHQVVKLPTPLRVGGWPSALTISAYRDVRGELSFLGGFGSASQIQVDSRLQDAYPRVFNLGVSAGWVITDDGSPVIETLPARGSGHLRQFSPSGVLFTQTMVGAPTLRVDWRAAFASMILP